MTHFRFFLHTLPRSIVGVFHRRYLVWHGVAIAATAFVVLAGFDWWYFVNTRMIGPTFFMSSVVLGALVPIVVPVGMLVVGYVRRSDIIVTIGYMLGQAAIVGSVVSSGYKALTGRVQPDLAQPFVDISRQFQFGFLRHGIFWGWPSSHTTIAFAMAVALIVLFPAHRTVKVIGLVYAFMIGAGISVSIHWFSEFVAGAIIGTVVGVVVGKTFAALPLCASQRS